MKMLNTKPKTSSHLRMGEERTFSERRLLGKNKQNISAIRMSNPCYVKQNLCYQIIRAATSDKMA